MEKKERLQFNKIAAAIVIILLLSVMGTIIFQDRKTDGHMAYLAENFEYADILQQVKALRQVRILRRNHIFSPEYWSEDGIYLVRLYRDGTFSCCCLISSKLEIRDSDAPENFYRWDGDALTLDYGDSDGVLCFRKEGDTLVFQKERSVLPEGSFGAFRDGLIFKNRRTGRIK